MFGRKKAAATADTPEGIIEGYRRDGVTEYMFMAPFDERTCPVCGDLDHMTFPVERAEVGVNFPPMHPGCRCRTSPAPTEEYLRENPTREITDRSSNKQYKVPRNFTYRQWYDRFGPGRTDGVEYVPKFRDDE